MTTTPDTTLTLACLALGVAVTWWLLLAGRPRARLSDAAVRERFPAVAERMRARHFH